MELGTYNQPSNSPERRPCWSRFGVSFPASSRLPADRLSQPFCRLLAAHSAPASVQSFAPGVDIEDLGLHSPLDASPVDGHAAPAADGSSAATPSHDSKTPVRTYLSSPVSPAPLSRFVCSTCHPCYWHCPDWRCEHSDPQAIKPASNSAYGGLGLPTHQSCVSRADSSLQHTRPASMAALQAAGWYRLPAPSVP